MNISRPTKRLAHTLAVHRNTPNNNPSIPFEFTPDNHKRAAAIVAKYPPNYKKAAVMPLLDLGQRQLGFTSISVMNYVAKLLQMPPMRVYEVATFYTMYNRSPMGKYHLQVCGTTPCQLRGASHVMHTLTATLGISPGETSQDGLFTLSEVECLGACVNAPMLAVNDDYYEDLDPDAVCSLVADLRAGNPVALGPCRGARHTCEPLSGRKVLLSPEPFNVAEVTQEALNAV